MDKKIGIIGWIILAIMVGIALFAPIIATYDPHSTAFSTFLRPSNEHLLGTNDIGQDIFSELIYGTRNSLFVGFLSAVISVAIGTAIGIFSGWFGGTVDYILMKITAIFMTIPFIPAVIILSAFTRGGTYTIALILGIMSWTGTARVVRTQTMSIKKKEYIMTIQAIGASSFYILTRHIIKEIFPYLFYRFTIRVKSGILSESTLSFLGMGNPIQKSWGTIIYYAQAKNALLTDSWLWWILPPGICIAVVSCALMLVSYAMESRVQKQMGDKYDKKRLRGR